ncbi:MAG: nuclease-related domain-containing protein [Prosthecobacter sp.]
MQQVLSVTFDLVEKFWPHLVVTILVGFALLVCLWRAYRRGRYNCDADEAAAAALKRTARHSLKRLDPTHFSVLDEVYMPRHEGNGVTRLDHVVLSTHGIFIIQVQQESGIITGTANTARWICSEFTEEKSLSNPIVRNGYHVKALAEFLELPTALFFSVIYFEKPVTLSSNLPKHVLTKGLGRHIVSHKTKLISPEVLAAISARLEAHQVKQSIDSARQEHKAGRERRRRTTQESVAGPPLWGLSE